MRIYPSSVSGLLAISGITVVLGLAGCESERANTKIDPHPDTTELDDQKQQIAKDIADLAAGKDLSVAKDSKAFDDAKARLIARGSKIETTLIDNLRRSDDWGVRVGIIEVLMATGTKASIDHLIVCLDDPEPLVAFRANTLLIEMAQHSEIPASGTPAAGGLPPVPARPANDLSLEADQRIWATWQHEHGKALRAAWASWWSANKGSVEIK